MSPSSSQPSAKTNLAVHDQSATPAKHELQTRTRAARCRKIEGNKCRNNL
ncbi:MAG: hypothetical protein MI923_14270 [Phycisphaerales bacterium]|nr:hypothetical protein [Phycisphaerales bacterium]